MSIIVVSGAIANKHFNGGEAWVRLSWILGFKKLGFGVYFLEQIERETCVNAVGTRSTFDDSVNLAYFKQVIEQFGLAGSSALIYNNGEKIWGMTYGELLDLAEASDLLVNISGHLTHEPLMHRLRRKAYIDIDPGFTQFWHASRNKGARLSGHDFFSPSEKTSGRRPARFLWMASTGSPSGNPRC